MTQFFDEGGWTMFPTMLFGVLTVIASLKAYANADVADLKMIMTACATQALNSLLLASVLVVFGILGATSGALRVAISRPTAG